MKKKTKYRNVAQKAGELIFKDIDTEKYYCIVMKTLGDRRFEILTDTGILCVGKLKGSIRRNQRLLVNGICLAQKRCDTKSDILHIYNEAEVKQLRKYKELEDLDECFKKQQQDLFQSYVHDDIVEFESASDIDEI